MRPFRKHILRGIGLLLLGWFVGCGRPAAEERPPVLPPLALEATTGPVTVLPALGADTLEADPFEILGADLESGRLRVDVRFAGNCGLHEWWLVAVPAAASAPRAPLQAYLFHEDFGDDCGGTMTEVLRFDLSPLAGADPGGVPPGVTLYARAEHSFRACTTLAW